MNSDLSASMLAIIGVITLFGVIYMFRTFSFKNEKPYRVKAGVVKLPGMLVWMTRFGAITFLLILLHAIFFGRTLGQIIEGMIVFLSFLFIHYITERRQIEIKDGIIIVTPTIGGRREVPCEEIKEIVIHKSPGISVFTLMKSNGKRHVRFSTWHWGWEDFMKELEEYDIPRIEIKE